MGRSQGYDWVSHPPMPLAPILFPFSPVGDPLLPDADPLLTLAIVLIAGVLSGAAARAVRLPGITGQILAGLILGAGILHVFPPSAIRGLEPMTHFALGLMAVTVGAHLNIKRLRNAGKRLSILLLAEATVTPAIVLAVMLPLVYFIPGIEGGWPMALLLAAIAVSTAPATIVALVKESRAQGVFVKTLVAAVALNNVACILLFEIARSVGSLAMVPEVGPAEAIGLRDVLIAPLGQFLWAVLFGGLAALFMEGVTRFVHRAEVVATAGIVTILLTSGLSDYFNVSPLLSCLVLGMVQTNLSPSRDKLVDSIFANFEPAILAVFFTLAGMELSFEHIEVAGLVALAYFAARAGGKLLAVKWAMKAAGATQRVRSYLGMSLLPQAGLAIGLVILIQEDPNFSGNEAFLDMFLAVVLTAVTLNELVGPVLTRTALTRSGESGKDRTRLIDFIQEENIITNLQASSMHEAIENMVDLMLRSHHMKSVSRAALLESVLTREAQASTCFGGGLAVPHAILPEGHAMVGVMGLSNHGIDVPTPDGRPVRVIVLLGTCPGERSRHLQVLAALAKAIGSDADFQNQLASSDTPAHAHDILHGEESENFNYFLEHE